MRLIAIIASVFSIVCTEYVAGLKYLQPEQVHIAFGEKQNDIAVTWSTLNETKETLLQFGEDRPTNQVTGNSKIFIDEGKLKWRQWIHRVQLKDLKFNTTYYYKVGSRYGWSKIFSFTTPESEENLAVRALVFGDLGVRNGLSLPFMLDDLKENRYDVILNIGDLAYDMHDDNGTKGNLFMRSVEPMAAKIPFMIVPGNHEKSYNFSHVKNRFSMPGFEKFESMYHSFDLGLVHFIGINTEAYYSRHGGYVAPFTDEPGQLIAHYNWLKQDLEEANRPENRQKHPWIVVFGHRPFYCSNSWGSDGCRNNTYFQRVGINEYGGLGLEKLLMETGVDLAIWAHEHSYERFWPVYDSKVHNGSYEQPYVNPRYPVQVTTGSAGCSEATDGFIKNPEPWSAFRSRDYGYARFYCPNRTHIYFEQLSVRDVKQKVFDNNEHSKIIDSLWLVKDDHKRYDV